MGGGAVNWVDSSRSVSAPLSHEALDSLRLFCTHQGSLLSPEHAGVPGKEKMEVTSVGGDSQE